MIRTSGNFAARWVAFRTDDARTSIITPQPRAAK